jgi:hypothetical protein
LGNARESTGVSTRDSAILFYEGGKPDMVELSNEQFEQLATFLRRKPLAG